MAPSSEPELVLPPLTARSVVLSLLLGSHPPELTSAGMVDAGVLFGSTEATIRVALTRMVAAGELHRSRAGYRLSGRMLDRQAAQDEALDPAVRDWDGTWETVVVTGSGRPARERARLRSTLTRHRLGELREGVWLRPANLARSLPSSADRLLLRATSTEDDAVLAARVWPLADWAATAAALDHAWDAAPDPGRQLAVGAAVLRHLLTDPVLPAAAAPPDWPAAALRRRYAAFVQATASAVRDGRTTLHILDN